MKKKIFVITIVMALFLSVLAGCGGSKKKYIKDAKAISSMMEEMEEMGDLDDLDDWEDLAKDLKKAVKKMSFSTAEGKKIKSAYEDFADAMGKAAKSDNLEEAYEKLEKAMGKIEDSMEDFADAAEKAGVDWSEVDF